MATVELSNSFVLTSFSAGWQPAPNAPDLRLLFAGSYVHAPGMDGMIGIVTRLLKNGEIEVASEVNTEGKARGIKKFRPADFQSAEGLQVLPAAMPGVGKTQPDVKQGWTVEHGRVHYALAPVEG